MVKLELKKDLTPVCPHCEGVVHTVYMNEIEGFLGRRYIYFCPHCLKVLGVSHRKGFFMG